MSDTKLPLLEICVVTGLVVRDDVAGTRLPVVHYHDQGRDKVIKLYVPPAPDLKVRFVPAKPVQVQWHPCVTLGGLRQVAPNSVTPGVIKALSYERSPVWAAHWGYNFGSNEMARHLSAPFERVFNQYEEPLLASILLRNGEYTRRKPGEEVDCSYVLVSTGEHVRINVAQW